MRMVRGCSSLIVRFLPSWLLSIVWCRLRWRLHGACMSLFTRVHVPPAGVTFGGWRGLPWQQQQHSQQQQPQPVDRHGTLADRISRGGGGGGGMMRQESWRE